MGFTHGGAIFSLADYAFAQACNFGDNVAVAVQVSINFLKPSVEGDTLMAEATRISDGKTMGLYNVTVYNQRQANCRFLWFSLQKVSNVLVNGIKNRVSQQYFYVSHSPRIPCWGGRTVQAVACRAALYGFNSHPQLHSSTLVPQPISISLKGTSTNPKRIDIYGIKKIYETTLKRLKTKTDITEEDRKSILEFVDHLLAKNMTPLRVVKYMNQLTVIAAIAVKTAGKPLGNFDRKGMESQRVRIQFPIEERYSVL